MASSGKKKILIIASVLIIAGVGGYFIYRKIRSKKEEEERKKAEEQARIEAEKKPSVGGGGGGGYSAPVVYTHSSHLKTKTDGDKFRGWVNDKYPDYAKKEQIARTGDLNSWVEKAWVKYGNEYSGVGSASSQTSSNVIGKNAVANKDSYVYSSPSTEKLPSYSGSGDKLIYAIGMISSGNKLGKIKGVRENEGTTWYEVEVSIGLSTYNATEMFSYNFKANPKIGWIKSSNITVQ